MKGMLYILGTSHSLQCGAPDAAPDAVALFETELRNTCHTLGIQRISEEMSKDALKLYAVSETVGQRVAKDIGIAHHNIDLSREERASLSFDDFSSASFILNFGFSDGGSIFRNAFTKIVHEARERCWSARILARNEWPTLFICGADHVKAVQKLWRSLGLMTNIIHKDYWPAVEEKVSETIPSVPLSPASPDSLPISHPVPQDSPVQEE